MAALVAIISSLILFLPVAQASGVKEPSYRIMKEDGKVEIREYQPYIMAQVAGTGDFQGAMYSGFMKLFNYISGKNTNRSKIKMTVPVTEEQVTDVTASEKIPMTAPVTQERSGNMYIISFIMPENYNMDTLPVPEDRSITFRQVPAHKSAVLKFSGRMKQDLADKKIAELTAYLAKNGLEAKSNFLMAQYNPPWIPGFMRRNEVIVQV
jgi:hypothetical protein